MEYEEKRDGLSQCTWHGQSSVKVRIGGTIVDSRVRTFAMEIAIFSNHLNRNSGSSITNRLK